METLWKSVVDIVNCVKVKWFCVALGDLRYLEDVLPLDNNNSKSGLKGLDMLAVFDPWIKDDTGLVSCDGPRHMYWSMEDAKYKDVDSVLSAVSLNEAAIGLKESDKATDGLLNNI
ncbi:hypothetical protein Tco_0469558 [Tanacetum coccineum]